MKKKLRERERGIKKVTRISPFCVYIMIQNTKQPYKKIYDEDDDHDDQEGDVLVRINAWKE